MPVGLRRTSPCFAYHVGLTAWRTAKCLQPAARHKLCQASEAWEVHRLTQGTEGESAAGRELPDAIPLISPTAAHNSPFLRHAIHSQSHRCCRGHLAGTLPLEPAGFATAPRSLSARKIASRTINLQLPGDPGRKDTFFGGTKQAMQATQRKRYH